MGHLRYFLGVSKKLRRKQKLTSAVSLHAAASSIFVCVCVCEFPAQNGEWFKNVRTSIQSLTEARLPYPTQTGGHRVCIKRIGDPAPRLLTNRGRENHVWHFSASPLRLASDCGGIDNSEIQGLASPWDTIPIQAQDATQQRGAATTRREANLRAKGVTNHTTGTRTSKLPDSNPHATQSTRKHTNKVQS